MELEQELKSVDSGLSDIQDRIEKYINEVSGIRREFGPFAANVDEKLNLSIESQSGWALIVPKMTIAWSIIIDWLKEWDDESRELMENYVKILAFPTSVRLSDIDEQYITDIINAHDALTKRNELKNKQSEDEQDA